MAKSSEGPGNWHGYFKAHELSLQEALPQRSQRVQNAGTQKMIVSACFLAKQKYWESNLRARTWLQLWTSELYTIRPLNGAMN